MLRLQRAYVGTFAVELNTVDEAGVPITPTRVDLACTPDDDTVVAISAITINGNGPGKHFANVTVARTTFLDLEWTVDSGVTYQDGVMVASRPILTPDELREVEPTLAPTTVNGLELAKAIEEAEVECERITGRHWTARYVKDTYDISPLDLTIESRQYNVSRIGKCVRLSEGTATTTAPMTLVAIPHSRLLRFPCPGRFEVGVVSGEVEAPLDIRSAVAQRARVFYQRQRGGTLTSYGSTVSGKPDGGQQITRMLGSILTTGSPEVDAIYAAHRANWSML